MTEPVLVIIAAGMGTRYSRQSGLKQVDSVGPHGEKIIDYSLYDARKAGFRRVVFVIKEEHLSLFQESVFPAIEPFMEVGYVFQKLEDVPEGCKVPDGRERPWGTGHAALTAARTLGDAPYAVINADDFYGQEGFQKIYDFLKNARDDGKSHFAMVGYYLKNTVTENGYVSRGVCSIENGLLQGVTERTHIEKQNGNIVYTEDDGKTWNPQAPDTVVSMNLWGFTPSFTPALERDFARLFQEDVPKNPLKSELFLPFAVNSMLDRGEAEVTVLSSSDKWYGVTYHEDKATVAEAMKAMTDQGKYPSPLWK